MIFIDYNDKRPIYEQIIDRFQTLIINGGLEPNMQLPSVRSLAIDLAINANTIQELRDKLEARDRDIMVRDFQLSQLAQNQYLVNEIRPCAKPAYITCSPYTTASFCGAGV